MEWDRRSRRITEDSETDISTYLNLFQSMLKFSIPFLIACFLQSFYGLADLFIIGQFYGADAVSAVSIGSQIMHMLTVIIAGFTVGTTVSVGRLFGAAKRVQIGIYIGNSIVISGIVSVLFTAALIPATDTILLILSTPTESFLYAEKYLHICFVGLPFIFFYNNISAVCRGFGDSRTPMRYVAVSGIINLGLDYLLIGYLRLGAGGAAIATVASQTAAAALSAFHLYRNKMLRIFREDLRIDRSVIGEMVSVGLPISIQDGLIQVSFLVITAIANSRGVFISAAVGIVEKLISFLFLVHSAMLSTVSVLSAQNAGAGRHERSRRILMYGCRICLIYGILIFLIGQPASPAVMRLFSKAEPEVVRFGTQYLRAYLLDCIFAGIHFCFSGYFSSYGKSAYSFLHNILSILLIRIPGAYLATVLFPQNLYPMGLASGMGSIFSSIICLIIYRRKFSDPAAVFQSRNLKY